MSVMPMSVMPKSVVPKSVMPKSVKNMLPTAGMVAAINLGFPAMAFAYGASGPSGNFYHGSHMWDGGWGGWFLGPIMMIVFIAVAVAVVVLLVRWLGETGHGRGPHADPRGKPPLDILKERFARGEIDKEEFEERRRVLED